MMEEVLEVVKSEGDVRQGDIPSHHLRFKTLQSIHKRLAILHNESSAANFMPDVAIPPAIQDNLTKLRSLLQKIRNENALLAMQNLLKNLETELEQREIDPDVHIEWVLAELKKRPHHGAERRR